ncbi:hypothetical protein L210DRAFT_2625942 [Boletus edulis BED1]|uniref:Uncharacterized protein n=1 Tax=Boletus edulis BED1 TaxID=1328754 RepID=A0AAD4GKZ7_BOLED|nr:hypothetical protein L210DRAFT_2625942 [Boletus edulis BED1]
MYRLQQFTSQSVPTVIRTTRPASKLRLATRRRTPCRVFARRRGSSQMSPRGWRLQFHRPPGADKIAGGTHDTHTYDTRTEDTCMHDIQRPHKGRLTPTRYPRNPLYPCHGTRSRYARGFNFTEWFISRAFNLWFNHILHLTFSQCVNSVEEQCKTSLIMLYF